jgi:hypothetical protein
MTHSYRTFVRSGVSTEPGQAQDVLDIGETISTAELARRLGGGAKGGWNEQEARKLRSLWERSGRAQIEPGGRGKSTSITRIA